MSQVWEHGFADEKNLMKTSPQQQRDSNLRSHGFGLKKRLSAWIFSEDIKILKQLRLFAPGSVGSSRALSRLALQSANQTFPFLSNFLRILGTNNLPLVDAVNFPQSNEELASANELKKHLDSRGSDKATGHNYHLVYGSVLLDREKISSVLEIGLGTNNKDVVSNMGSDGKPGASLRAFRDFLPNAMVYGADIDKRILFEESRIKTFYVDQLDPLTFDELAKNIPGKFDMIIDDGLHSPNANIAVLSFGITKLKLGGWLIIEDIVESAIPLWEVVAALLPSRYECHLIRAQGGLIFAAQFVSS
jgi:hypothetical protein